MTPFSTESSDSIRESSEYLEMLQRIASTTGYDTVYSTTTAQVSQSGMWITDDIEHHALNAINDTAKWVDKEHKAKLISELDEFHLKRILDGFNMGKTFYNQTHKMDALVAQYEKLQHDK